MLIWVYNEFNTIRKGIDTMPMKRFTVYIDNASYRPEFQNPTRIGGALPPYARRVNANNRTHALTKCLPDIRREFPKLKGKFVAIFVGETCNPSAYANRLSPIQIDMSTGDIRKLTR